MGNCNKRHNISHDVCQIRPPSTYNVKIFYLVKCTWQGRIESKEPIKGKKKYL